MAMTAKEIKASPNLGDLYNRLMSIRNTLKIAFPSAWKQIFESLARPSEYVGAETPRCITLPVAYPIKPSGQGAKVAIAGVDKVTWDVDKNTGLATNFVAWARPFVEVFGSQPEQVKVSAMEGMRILLEQSDLNQPSKKTRWYEDDDNIL